MGVSKNNGTPKSSILIGFSIIIYKPSMLGYPYFWKHPVSTGDSRISEPSTEWTHLTHHFSDFTTPSSTCTWTHTHVPNTDRCHSYYTLFVTMLRDRQDVTNTTILGFREHVSKSRRETPRNLTASVDNACFSVRFARASCFLNPKRLVIPN